jgi:hypothetical protein
MQDGGGIQAEYSITLDTCIDNVYLLLSAKGMFLRRDGTSPPALLVVRVSVLPVEASQFPSVSFSDYNPTSIDLRLSF